MNTPVTRAVATALLLCASATAVLAQDLSGKWNLRVEDLQHQVKVTAVIRFSDDHASSCMAGNWKRLVVDTQSVGSSEFFPMDSALAYEVKDGTLVMGRTQVCDAYLFLAGELRGSLMRGNYTAVTIGSSRRLGYFSVTRNP